MNLALSGSAFALSHGPDAHQWFGTDVLARDVFSRTLCGASISLLVGVFGAGVSLVIGVLWGALVGYAGGGLDGLLMRTVDVLYSLPSGIFVIVLITTVGKHGHGIVCANLGLCCVSPGSVSRYSSP